MFCRLEWMPHQRNCSTPLDHKVSGRSGRSECQLSPLIRPPKTTRPETTSANIYVMNGVNGDGPHPGPADGLIELTPEEIAATIVSRGGRSFHSHGVFSVIEPLLRQTHDAFR